MRWLAYWRACSPTTTCTCAPTTRTTPPERYFTAENVDRYLAAARRGRDRRARRLRARLPLHARRSSSGATRSGSEQARRRPRRLLRVRAHDAAAARDRDGLRARRARTGSPTCSTRTTSTTWSARSTSSATAPSTTTATTSGRRSATPTRSGAATSSARRGWPAPASSTSSPTPTWSRSGAPAGPLPERDPRFHYEPAVEAIAESGSRSRSRPPGCASRSARSTRRRAFAEMCVEAGRRLRALLRRPRCPEQVGFGYDRGARVHARLGDRARSRVFERPRAAARAARRCRAAPMSVRVGIGYDSHRFAEGRRAGARRGRDRARARPRRATPTPTSSPTR